jgi:hypothetical protein
MPFTAAAKDTMLNSLVLDAIRLHSGAPGAAGTANALGAGLSAATFGTSTSGSRSLSPAVTVAGLAANQSVTHFSVWTTAGSVFRGSGAITSGDVTANSAGSFTLATGTTLTLSDS